MAFLYFTLLRSATIRYFLEPGDCLAGGTLFTVAN